VRFGDPETQVLMMRLKSDLLLALVATAQGTLGDIALDWHDDAALCVVMAAKGYPGSYQKGTAIKGLAHAGDDPDVEIFHAGTAVEADSIVAAGGRVLGITARGRTIPEAHARAYAAVDQIDWPDGFCRRDIGWRAIGRDG
jgi:phosphoribosylamine--glycine ligase